MSDSSHSESTLQRGKACLSCRRRKMKCDGGRPICGQCMRGNRMDDCEYTDTQGRTRTQILEENLARLQARIQELENPQSSSPGILLHDPYASSSSSRRSGSSHASSAASNENLPLFSPPQSIPTAFPERPLSVPAVMSWWELEEPPFQVTDLLVKQFLPHATQLSFVLNVPRFIESLNLPTLHPDRPHPALLNAIYLWALHISRDADLMQRESVFLQRAILSLQDALAGDGANITQSADGARGTAGAGGSSGTAGALIARKRVHAMQAEVLLSLYFFCQGRPIEGRYHANAAVSLAISCGLHRIRPQQTITPPNSSSGRGGKSTSSTALNTAGGHHRRSGKGLFDLVPARDVIELGERVNAFWAVFNLDRCFSVAIGSPPIIVDAVSPGSQIDTPWPLDMDEYELIDLMSASSQMAPGDESSAFSLACSTKTVQTFLEGQVSSDVGNSSSALRVKASALFESAFRLSASWKAKTGQPQVQATLQADMTSLARTITRYARSLVPVDRIEGQIQSPDARRTLLLDHSLAHDAMIRLHEVRDSVSPAGDLTAANACLVHASEILRVLEYVSNDADYTSLMDPIIGTAWYTAAKVFSRELARVQRAGPSQATESRLEALQSSIGCFQLAIDRASITPVSSPCMSKIQENLKM